jgi:hypothetical protein
MEQALGTENWPNHFDQFDRDVQLKRALEVLEKENSQLRQLVVRLSETIIRNVTAKQ